MHSRVQEKVTHKLVGEGLPSGERGSGVPAADGCRRKKRVGPLVGMEALTISDVSQHAKGDDPRKLRDT